MILGLSEADCRVARLREEQMRVVAEQRRFVAHERTERRTVQCAPAPGGRRIELLLARAGQRLRGVRPMKGANREAVVRTPADTAP